MKLNFLRGLCLIFLICGLLIQAVPVQAKPLQIPSAYDVIAAVNALRVSKGLPEYQVSSSLMTTAQAQSDYQASIGTWTHSGPDGTGPHERIQAAGYYGYENVAIISTSKDMNYLIYTLWADSVHWSLMVNTQYTYCGAGVTESGGMIYITLHAGYVFGQPASSSGTVYSTTTGGVTGATATSNSIEAVITTTAQADGKVIHMVEHGQAMHSIAIAYGVKVADIQKLNGYTGTNYTIYVGQKLIIRLGNTATPSATVTETPPPPTRTLNPTSTKDLMKFTSTPRPTNTLTPLPLLPKMPSLESNQRQSVGIILIVVCGLGLTGVLVSRFLKKK